MARHRIPVLLTTPDPEPAYAEFEDVRAEASRRNTSFVSTREIERMEEVAGRRGYDWCSAVLGRGFPGVARVPGTEAWMLIVADERGLEPPLPQRIVDSRREFDERRDDDRRRREEATEQARRQWDLAVASCPVQVTVHSNLKRVGRRELLHAVPGEPVRSKRGVHPAGRALCEHRRNPRTLGESIDDGTATCQSCVRYVAEIRSMDSPAPPTKSERALLQLVAGGKVATIRHLVGGTDVRVPSEPSNSRCGHMGRKVTALADRLQSKGWAEPVVGESVVDGRYGLRWQLTDAGTAALEW